METLKIVTIKNLDLLCKNDIFFLFLFYCADTCMFQMCVGRQNASRGALCCRFADCGWQMVSWWLKPLKGHNCWISQRHFRTEQRLWTNFPSATAVVQPFSNLIFQLVLVLEQLLLSLISLFLGKSVHLFGHWNIRRRGASCTSRFPRSEARSWNHCLIRDSRAKKCSGRDAGATNCRSY